MESVGYLLHGPDDRLSTFFKVYELKELIGCDKNRKMLQHATLLLPQFQIHMQIDSDCTHSVLKNHEETNFHVYIFKKNGKFVSLHGKQKCCY